jgi:hypothetical protein
MYTVSEMASTFDDAHWEDQCMTVMPAQFAGQSSRGIDHEATETWWFSVVDPIHVMTQQPRKS